MFEKLTRSLPMTTQRTLEGVELPTSYRKLVATKFSNDFREAAAVSEVPMPRLGTGEVLCRVLYAAVNASDRLKTDGYYGDTETPFDLGLEALAQVVAVGPGVPGSFLGKFRALSDTGEKGGMFSEYVVAHAFKGMSIPVRSGEPKYAATVVTGFSIAVCMATECTPKKGQTILITAAAGSGGTYAVQLAKRRGAHVIGTCGSAEKADLLREIGCDRAINYREENVGEVLSREYPDGVDWVLENVGGDMFDLCVDHIAERGTIVVFGFVSEHLDEGKLPRASVGQRLLAKSAHVKGFAVKHYLKTGLLAGMKLIRGVSRNKIKAVIDPHVFEGIESVADAVEHHNAGKNIGKVLIRLS